MFQFELCPAFKLFLETLPDYQSKIKHLKTALIECEAVHLSEEHHGGSSDEIDYEKQSRETFITECKIEIKRLEQLSELEVKLEQGTDDIKKHKDLTLDRATLLLNYLFTFAKANCHNTKKSEVISFLTGYSENTVGDKLSALYSKADENFVAYEKDMKIIRKYFEKLGLSKIVELIDRDLEIEK